MTATEKKTLYTLLHELVRLRDGARCLRCQKEDRLQLSHIYPKGRHRRMEMEPLNVKLLCVGCHLFWWHRSPIEAWDWLRETLPLARLERLKLQANAQDRAPFDYKLQKLFLEHEILNLRKGTRISYAALRDDAL